MMASSTGQDTPKSRQEVREQRKEEARQDNERKAEALTNEENLKQEKKDKPAKVRVRLIPIWLRLIITAILLGISLMAGAMVGYGVIGEGDHPMDVFEKSTWQHMIDIVVKE